jgi:hypothetical protein
MKKKKLLKKLKKMRRDIRAEIGEKVFIGGKVDACLWGEYVNISKVIKLVKSIK